MCLTEYLQASEYNTAIKVKYEEVINMYPATPTFKDPKNSVKIQKVAMLPVELLKRQELLRALPVK